MKNPDKQPTNDNERIIRLARDMFKRSNEREQDTRLEGLDDLRFARLGEQWPLTIRRQREIDGRPCLVINKLPAFIRQVVNDARQNMPAIVVNPVDDKADMETAEVINGLIRNIQVTSDADIATDTAIESAVSNGFGYFRLNITEDEDGFKDIAFERIVNPFSVYADPHSEAADSSDWNTCLVVTMLSRTEFQDRYKGAAEIDWDSEGYRGLPSPWIEGDEIMVAEFWHREDSIEPVVILTDGSTVDAEWFEENREALAIRGVFEQTRRDRKTKKVTQYILTGAEVLETNEWPGKFIPIVPVYGDEINVEGKRVFRSLINSAKDPQRMHNYWRTTATELVALSPKTPFMAEEGSIIDAAKWGTANQIAHAYLEYKKGAQRPSREPFAGVPAGVLQEALNAGEDMKAILGLYDASLGAQGNETSGVAIAQRQRQGNISTFHFIDNLSRSIRHAGRIVIDLVQKVYAVNRVIRIMGEDGKPDTKQIVGPSDDQQPETGMEGDADDMGAIPRAFDLTAGKYDLVVKSGPNYATMREETRTEIIEIIRAFPQAAPILGPMYLRHCDWPGADEAAEKLEQVSSQPEGEQGSSMADMAKVQNDARKNDIAEAKVQMVDVPKAQADLMKAQADMIRAEREPAFAGIAGSNL